AVRAGGALLDGEPAQPLGSVIVYEAADEAAARAMVDADPYAKAGLFASVELRPWRQAVGVALATGD
ncbi:MAG: YciI family protein, partial [Hyphomicrobiales bacterium]|nr:YciI family protein [Hyphomicrobiales bacterium]